MTSKSKTKGKSFERDIAKYFSDLYNDSFTRVPDSGAYTGGKNSFRKNNLTEGQIRSHKGDIIPPDNWKYFNCECKNYADFPFHQLLTQGPIPILEQWLEQTLDAANTGDCSILIMKFNRIGKYLAFQMPKDFKTYRHIDYQDKNNNLWRITGFDDFFSLNTNEFKKHCTGNIHYITDSIAVEAFKI